MSDKLTVNEQEAVRRKSVNRVEYLMKIEMARSFAVGDFLICKRLGMKYDNIGNSYIQTKELILNSYNAAKRFIVVCKDDSECSWLKEVDAKGKPRGEIIDLMDSHGVVYELDPIYTDACIMGEQGNYLDGADFTEKAKIFKDIAKFNKTVKVRAENVNVIDSFFAGLAVGDKFWASNTKYYTVTNTRQEPYVVSMKTKYWIKHAFTGSVYTVMDLLASNGVTMKDVDAGAFMSKAIYSAPPRSYKELKI